MPGEIDRLFVSIGADIKGFLTGMSGVQAAASGLAGNLGALGNTLTKNLTLPLLGFGAAAVGSAMTVEKGMNAIVKATGATGSELEGLGQVMRNVAKTSGRSIEDIGVAVGELATRTGYTGEQLETMTRKMLKLAKVTNTDLNTVIVNSTRLFGDWQIAAEDQIRAMEKMYRVCQLTGIPYEQLSEKVVTFGSSLRGLGFDFDTSIALIGKFEKEGVVTDRILAALRIGFVRMAKEGITDAKEAMAKLIDEIKKAPSDMDAASIALQVFGSRAAADFTMAVREGRFELGELLGEVSNADNVIDPAAEATKTLAERMNALKNQVILALEPVGVRLMEAIEKSLPAIQRMIEFVADLIEKFADLPGWAQNAVLAIGGLLVLAGPVSKLAAAIVGLGSATAGAGAAAGVAAGGFSALHIALLAAAGASGYFIGKKISEPIVKAIEDSAAWEAQLESLEGTLRTWGGTMDDLGKTMSELGYRGEDLLNIDEAFRRIVQTGELAAAQLSELPGEIAVAFQSKVGYLYQAGTLGMLKYVEGFVSQTGRGQEEAHRIALVIRDGLASQDPAIRANAQGMMRSILDELVAGGKMTAEEALRIKVSIAEFLKLTGGEAAGIGESWSRWAHDLIGLFGQVEGAAQRTKTTLLNMPTAPGAKGGKHIAMQHGGIVTRPTLALIGEAGPEAVIPLERYGGGIGINIYGNINLPGVRDPQDFISWARRQAQESKLVEVTR